MNLNPHQLVVHVMKMDLILFNNKILIMKIIQMNLSINVHYVIINQIFHGILKSISMKYILINPMHIYQHNLDK
jgi:hypothetical protein